MITKTVKKLLRRLGVDLVKWTSGYQLIRFPGVGEELSPLDQLHAGLENQLQGQCHFACAVSVPSAGGPDLRKGTL